MPIAPVRPAIMSRRRVPYLRMANDCYVDIPTGVLSTAAITVLGRVSQPAVPTTWLKWLNTGPTTTRGIVGGVSSLTTDLLYLMLTWDSGAVAASASAPGRPPAFLAVGSDGTTRWGGANGVWASQGAVGTTPDWTGRPLVIGASHAHAERFRGVVYGVWVYDRLLTAQEVQSAYQGNPPRDGLVGAWLLNEGSGTVAYDASGNGHHGTITGGTWVTNENTRASPLSPVRTVAPVR